MTPAELVPVIVALAADHLWQSTLCALVAALLVVACRNNRATVRSWIWLAASVKFLIPFSALGAIGGALARQSGAPAVPAEVVRVMDGMARPFSRPELWGSVEASSFASSSAAHTVTVWMLAAVWLCGAVVVLGVWAIRWRRAAAVVHDGRVVRAGRETAILQRLSAACGIQKPLVLVSSQVMTEPGVFGIFKPVILWPQTIGERLDDEHVQAIMAHELSHVRRKDNLAAAIHTIVQSLFWFHPVVWLVGARLVQEREQACDEAAIHLGSEPQVYAESILKTCQFSLGLPPVLVARAAGSNLKRRIEVIMGANAHRSLSVWKQVLLATVVAGALAGPLVAGVMNAQEASIRVEISTEQEVRVAYSAPAEAVQQRLARVDGRRYQHFRTGITFEIPEGWMAGATYHSSDNGEQVVLSPTTDPRAMFYVWMVKEPVRLQDIDPWLDGAPQQKLEQRHGNYRIPGTEGYRLREGSVYRTVIGQHHGIVAIADYTEIATNRAMAEYMTWIYTEKGRTFFFARVAADDLIRLQGQFEAIVNSAVIP